MIVFLPLDAVALLLAISFAPPLLIAFAAEAWFFAARRGRVDAGRWRERWGYALTLIGSVVVGVALLNLVPAGLGEVLSMQQVSMGGHRVPITPAAFLAVAIVAPAVSLWVVSDDRA